MKTLIPAAGGILALLLLATPACNRPEAQNAPPAPLQASTQATIRSMGDTRISGPYVHENLQVFLIHGKDQAPGDREVLTLKEALEQKQVKVYETGEVQELAIENLSPDTEIYVQSGDIVQGGKQDRVITTDLILPAKSGKMPLATFCVEQGRWSPRQGTEAVNPLVMMCEFSRSSNALSSIELKRAVKVAEAQREVWAKVEAQQGKLADNLGSLAVYAASSPSSLELTLEGEKVKEARAAYEKKLASIVNDKEDVVGYAFAINGKLNCADVYSSRKLFRKLWGKLLAASAVEAVSERKRDQKYEPVALEAVRAFLEVEVKDDAKAQPKDVSERVQLLTVDCPDKVFFETRDRAHEARWIHRSYLAKNLAK